MMILSPVVKLSLTFEKLVSTLMIIGLAQEPMAESVITAPVSISVIVDQGRRSLQFRKGMPTLSMSKEIKECDL